MVDLNRVELGIIAKVTEKHKGAPHMAIQKLFKFHDIANSGHVNFNQFVRALETVSANIEFDTMKQIFNRYSGGSDALDYRTFARVFVDGSVRDVESDAGEPEPISVQDVIQKVKSALTFAPYGSLIDLAVEFRQYDNSNSRALSLGIARDIITHNPIYSNLSPMEIEVILDAFRFSSSSSASGAFHYDPFIQSLCVEIRGKRLEVLQKAFDRLDTDSDGAIDVADLSRIFRAENDPSVTLKRELTSQDVLRRFIGLLETLVAYRRDLVDPLMRKTKGASLGHAEGAAGTRTIVTPVKLGDITAISWDDFRAYYAFLGASAPFAAPVNGEDAFVQVVSRDYGLEKPHVALDVFESKRPDPAQLPAAGHHLSPRRIDLHHRHEGDQNLPRDPRWRAPSEQLDPAEPFRRAARTAASIGAAGGGVKGCSKLIACVLLADEDSDGNLTIQDLRSVCRDTNNLLRFTADEEASLFRQWGVPINGAAGHVVVVIPVETILDAFWGSLDGECLAIVHDAWIHCSRNRRAVPLPELIGQLALHGHPIVESGIQDEYVLKRDLTLALRALCKADPSIPSNQHPGATRDEDLLVSEPTFFSFHQIVRAVTATASKTGVAHPGVLSASLHRLWKFATPEAEEREVLREVELERQGRLSRENSRPSSPHRGKGITPHEKAALQHGEAILFGRGATAGALSGVPKYVNVSAEVNDSRNAPMRSTLEFAAGSRPGYGNVGIYVQGAGRAEDSGDVVDPSKTRHFRDFHQRFRRIFKGEGDVEACRENVTYKSRINITPNGGKDSVDAICERIRNKLASSMTLKPFVTLFAQADKVALQNAALPRNPADAPLPPYTLSTVGAITKADLQRVNKFASLGLSDHEVDVLFSGFSLIPSNATPTAYTPSSNVGKMDVYRLILAVQGELDGSRSQWVGQCWGSILQREAERDGRVVLDEEGYVQLPEYITLDRVLAHLSINAHPAVAIGAGHSSPALPLNSLAKPLSAKQIEEDIIIAFAFFAKRRNCIIPPTRPTPAASASVGVLPAVSEITPSSIIVDADVFGDVLHSCSASLLKLDEFRLFTHASFDLIFSPPASPRQRIANDHLHGTYDDHHHDHDDDDQQHYHSDIFINTLSHHHEAHGAYPSEGFDAARGKISPISHPTTRLPNDERLRDNEDYPANIPPKTLTSIKAPIRNPVAPFSPLDVTSYNNFVEDAHPSSQPGFVGSTYQRPESAPFSNNFFLGGTGQKTNNLHDARRQKQVPDNTQDHKFSKYW